MTAPLNPGGGHHYAWIPAAGGSGRHNTGAKFTLKTTAEVKQAPKFRLLCECDVVVAEYRQPSPHWLSSSPCTSPKFTEDLVMVNDTTAANVNTDAACEDARKDAEAIRDAFSHKGIQEAFDLLKAERKNASTLTAAEQEVYENEIVMALSGRNGGKADLLPGLSLAYLKDNKDKFTNADENDEFDAKEVAHQAERMFDKRELEQTYGKGENKVDDLQVALLGNAADLLRKNDYNGEDVLELDEVDDILKDSKENAAKEVGYEKTRAFNKQIAEAFIKNKTLFGVIDEIDGEKGDGKLTEGEVNDFLERIKKSEGFKARFSAEELKAAEDLKTTFDDYNNYNDANSNLVESKNWWLKPRKNWITEESITKAVGGKEAAEAIVAKANEGTSTTDQAKTEEKKEEVKKEEENKDSTENVDAKKDEVAKKDEESEKKEETKTEVSINGVVDENKLVEIGTQKAGEGPWQVAERFLTGTDDAAAQQALTQILKEQLVEDTQSKDYKEAVSKLKVGHNFLTCEGLEKLRAKVLASGNKTLMTVFGVKEPVKEEEEAEKHEEKK